MFKACFPHLASVGLLLATPLVYGAPVETAEVRETGRDDKEGAEPGKAQGERSPWLFVPLLSSSPKLDTAAGLMVGYLHQFDEESRPSLFTVSAKYTTSESLITSAFAKTSFGADHHRIVGGLIAGDINNDYADYLGSGRPLETNDNFRSAFLRYLYRVEGDWFVGGLAAYSNYEMTGRDFQSQQILDDLGLEGFTSGGLGLALQHDSRDSDFSATRGWYLNVNNLAYREALGGEENFDIYRVDYRGYWGHGDGHVLAWRSRNQFSHNAPSGSYSPIYLRGYTPGEYLGQHMSAVEVEERYKLAERWTATAFAGVACLYGDGVNGESLGCGDRDNVYPAWGMGVQYLLKPEAGIVANLEYAMGKDDNSGIYLKMGYSF
ncbi:BamA/TamA family outer membrane protein [Aeromonas sp. AE23HZ002T15]